MPPTTTSGLDPAKLGRFISAEHLTGDSLTRVHDWFHGAPRSPLVFRDFLRPEVAEAVGAALRDLPVWSRCVTAFRNAQETVEVDEAGWADRPDRVARHFFARPLLDAFEPGRMDERHQAVLKNFISFAVISDLLRSWLGAGVGFPLEKRTSVELACYEPGDEIRPHQDLIENRVIAVNFYLDRDYRPGTGARLGFRNEEGREFAVDPLFNSFSLIPIEESCHHWVEPFAGEGRGRYTVSIGEHRAA